jgi:hypothetical protein
MYAPTGVNLAWTVTVPGLALAFSPLTLLFGPAVSYNVAALLVPALAAWTAYLLCRHLTRSLWASVVGGYLFGFSASVLREEAWGNLHVTAVFLLPLIALVVVRYVEGELTGSGLSWRLGLLLALQLSISTEFALSATVVLALGLALAFWLVRDARPRLRSSLRPIVAGYVLGAVFAAPLVVFALLGFVSSSFVPVRESGSDLLNFVVPPRLVGIGGSSFNSVTSRYPDGGVGAYLGLPTLLIAAAFAFRGRRAPGARFLVAALATSALIALGTDLQVDGRRLIALPWRAVAHLPGFSNALPFRFSAYVALAAAVIVALWTARTRGRVYTRPYLLPVLAVAALVPAFWQPLFRSHPDRLAFFTDGLYKSCIARDETVVVFPFGGGGFSMLWQAETGFRFRLAEDGLQPLPKQGKPLNSFDRDPIVYVLNYADYARPTMDRLLAFAAIHHADRFLSVPSWGYPSRTQMQRLGPTQLVGGVLVSPACGQPSLQKRDLTRYVESYERDQVAAPSIGYCLGANYFALPRGLYPSGGLEDARRAFFVAGQGVTCAPPPTGYKHRGFASPALNVPADTYPYYAP